MKTKAAIAVALAVLLSTPAGANDSRTMLNADLTASPDSILVTGEIVFPAQDTVSDIMLMFTATGKIHKLYFVSETDSLAAQYHYTGGDTLVISNPITPAFTHAPLLRFDLAVPVNINDSLIMLDRGNRWYPVIPHGLTEVKLQITVPSDRQVFGTGNEERSDRGEVSSARFTPAFPVYKIALLVARSGYYRTVSRNVGDHLIALEYFSISDSAATKILAEAATAFDFYQQSIGPYAHRRLTIVETPGWEGTNIGTGILSVGSLTMTGLAAGDYTPLTLTIAAQWFGSGVFCDFPCQGFWFMNLSLSHYLRLLYEGRNLDFSQFAARIEANLQAYKAIAGSEGDVPIIDIMRPDTREKGLAIYSKGPFLLHKLRSCLGTTTWDANLRQLYRDYLGKVIAIDDFVRILGQSESGCAGQFLEDISRKGL